MTDASPPFAPISARFPCPSLLALAARASLGGAREGLLGAVMAVRLATGLDEPFGLDLETRKARAAGARSWLTALTLPAKARVVLMRAYAATAGDDAHIAADALDAVTEVTAPHLDRHARSELGRVIDALRRSAPRLPGSAKGP